MPTSHSYHIAPPKQFAPPPDPALGGTAPSALNINRLTPAGATNTSAQAMLYQLPVFDPGGVKNHKGTAYGSTPVEVAPGQALPTVPAGWLKNHAGTGPNGGLTGIPLFAAGSQDQSQQLNPIIGDQRGGQPAPTTVSSLRQDLPGQVMQTPPTQNFMGPLPMVPYLSPFGPAK